MRRVNISDPSQPVLMDYIDPKKVTYLPNTAGCFTADEAIRTLRLAREAGGWDLVKLEVLGEARTLYPDMRETLKATRGAGQGRLQADGLLRRRSDRGASSWKRRARWRSCRWARRSARGSASRTG